MANTTQVRSSSTMGEGENERQKGTERDSVRGGGGGGGVNERYEMG